MKVHYMIRKLPKLALEDATDSIKYKSKKLLDSNEFYKKGLWAK